MRHYYGHGTAAVFAPLQQLGRAELVTRRLVDAIELELLPDGSQLPGEIELASTFGVATVTIREALADLRQMGLIRTRRGRGGGSFVCAPEATSRALARRRLDRRSVMELRDLGDMYAVVSGGSAALAAARASADDLRVLDDALAQLAAADDAGGWRRADARLRVLVAVAAQSPRLYRAEIDLQAEVGMLLWLTVDREARSAELDACTALVGAVAQRRADAARDLAERRVREATARLIDHRLTEEDA